MFKIKFYKFLLMTFSALFVFNITFADTNTPNRKAMPWIPLLLLDGGEQKMDQLVYVSDEDTAGVYELYLVSSDKPGAPTKLNPQLVDGGDVKYNFKVNPDGSQVAYLADQDTDNVVELYLVDLSKPGVSIKLNAPLVAGGIVTDFVFSPDSSQVAYLADQDTDNVYDLYLVDLSKPGASIKLNKPLVTNNVGLFAFSPNSSQVAYRADQDTDNVSELYLVDLSKPETSIKLNAPLVAGREVLGFAFSPDGSQVAYRADQDTDNVHELYLVDLSKPRASIKLNAPLVAGGRFIGFLFSPDGSQVAYLAEQDTDNVSELYLVDLSKPGVSIKLNKPLVTYRTVTAFKFNHNGSQVAYRADQDTDNVSELYLVDLSKPGVSIKLNAPLVAGRDVSSYGFAFSPDASQVAYRADQDTDNVHELYLVDLSKPEASIKLNALLVAGWRVHPYGFAFSPDGSRVAYVSLYSSDHVSELNLVDLDTPGVATVLNDPLPLSLTINSFSFVPGQTHYSGFD